MSKQDFSFDAECVQVECSGSNLVDVVITGGFLDEVIDSVGLDKIVDECDNDCLLEEIREEDIITWLEDQGYNVEER